MTKPLVIYHKDCTDGFGAAFAAWLKFRDEAEYAPAHYGMPFLVDEWFDIHDRDVYILDFSFPREQMDYIFHYAKRVVWLDHHHSSRTMAEEICPPQPYPVETHQERFSIIHDNDQSGAMLAWRFFHPGAEVPMLIRHIDDRDRWQFKLEGSKELHAALASYKPWSFGQWKQLALPTYALPTRLKEGATLLRAQDAAVADMMKQARKCAISWHDTHVNRGTCNAIGLACNSQLHISELGHELANQSGTYGLVWYVGADNKVKCSLRSNGDYDVSAIAKAFDGGGHRNAAGFQTDIETLMGWLA